MLGAAPAAIALAPYFSLPLCGVALPILAGPAHTDCLSMELTWPVSAVVEKLSSVHHAMHDNACGAC